MGLKLNVIEVLKYYSINSVLLVPASICLAALRDNEFFQTLFYLLGIYY